MLFMMMKGLEVRHYSQLHQQVSNEAFRNIVTLAFLLCFSIHYVIVCIATSYADSDFWPTARTKTDIIGNVFRGITLASADATTAVASAEMLNIQDGSCHTLGELASSERQYSRHPANSKLLLVLLYYTSSLSSNCYVLNAVLGLKGKLSLKSKFHQL